MITLIVLNHLAIYRTSIMLLVEQCTQSRSSGYQDTVFWVCAYGKVLTQNFVPSCKRSKILRRKQSKTYVKYVSVPYVVVALLSYTSQSILTIKAVIVIYTVTINSYSYRNESNLRISYLYITVKCRNTRIQHHLFMRIFVGKRTYHSRSSYFTHNHVSNHLFCKILIRFNPEMKI